ncbi:MAG: methylated-DNA--[protein]-cysteine S-methyltransferase [Firmicutes bacterium]|nr:methylated-DNA--[protein]-cysteine S-methyltransferase [Bacillota bacterium]
MNNTTIETPIGKLTLVAEHGFLTKILFENETLPHPNMVINDNKDTIVLEKTTLQLQEYFAGKRKQFDIPLNPQGGDFLQRVWAIMVKDIKFGQTTSYSKLAEMAQSPKAARAVGMANNRNPIPIIIPCHRVLGKNGTLVGFRWGMSAKITLLQLEGITL